MDDPGLRLSRNARRTLLVLHVACGVGWMGADGGLAILMLTGWFSDDGPTVAAAYTAARLVIPPAVRDQVGRDGRHLLFPPLVSFVALSFALVVSMFKPWGRTRWGRTRVAQRREKVTTS